jgi:HK97 family phage portal protein
MRGFFGALRDGFEGKAQTLDQLPAFMLGGRQSKTGQMVTASTALQVSTVLCIAKVLAEGVAQVPWRLKRQRPNGLGSDDASDHPLFNLLARRPNSYQTSFAFRETIMLHLVLVGNAFVYISRSSDRRILELIPLDPGKVSVTRNADLSLSYAVTGDDGRHAKLVEGDIWHLRGMSWNGWMGMEPVKLAREAIGLALALEDSHALLHRNGVQTSGIYSVEGVLDEPQHAKITAWLKRHAGDGAKGGTLILDHAAKWMTTQMTGVDSQHLETRRFQIEELCRVARTMPIMVGQSDKAATYASAEQMFLAHNTHTLGPWYVRIEQSGDMALLGPDEQNLFTEFQDQALMRGDYKGRQEGLQIQRRMGVINANEWRALEGWNPRTDPEGDQYITDLNMGAQEADEPAKPNPVRGATEDED